MKTSELLHFALRARDPLALGRWYAELFEAQFLVHSVMAALGIVMVKLNHPEALFHGLVEFWPWDLEWDGASASFRKITPQPSPTSYGHAAVKVAADADTICAELERRGIPFRMEPRAIGFLIPVVHDPEGNMIELFPNVAHMQVPENALCPPEHIDVTLAQVKAGFAEITKEMNLANGVPLFLFEHHVERQQQQQQQ
jgi:catechol 2,3-dioxygenase-like lactoylglutathione lyase family enzyme